MTLFYSAQFSTQVVGPPFSAHPLIACISKQVKRRFIQYSASRYKNKLIHKSKTGTDSAVMISSGCCHHGRAIARVHSVHVMNTAPR